MRRAANRCWRIGSVMWCQGVVRQRALNSGASTAGALIQQSISSGAAG
jgi:hypothetical protein